MAKTTTASTLSPLVFVPGKDVFSEHQREVHEMQNFVVCRRPVTYLNVNGLPYEIFVNPRANRHIFSAALNTWLEVIRTHARVSADVQTFRCSARCQFAAAETGEVRFTVGASSVVLAVTSADNGSRVLSTTLATSATGTGLLTVLVEIRRTAGASTLNYARNLRLQSGVIAAASLPDPANT